MPLQAGPYSLEAKPSAAVSVLRLSDFEDVMITAGQMTSFFGATEANPHIMPVDLSHGAADMVICAQNQGDGSSATLTLVRETRPEYLHYGRWKFFGTGLGGTIHLDGFNLLVTCDVDICGGTGTVAADGNSFTFTLTGASPITYAILDRSACN